MNMQSSFPDVDMTSLTPHTCGTEVKVHEACMVDIILITAYFSCLFNQIFNVFFFVYIFSLIDLLIHSFLIHLSICYFIHLMMSSTLICHQDVMTRRANAQIVSMAASTRDTPRDIINDVLGNESDIINEEMVLDASLRRK